MVIISAFADVCLK